MDQPYSRIADSLLDYQYWSPNDPQRTPYDDTGWTFPELFNVQAARVTDVKVLDAAAEKVSRRSAPTARVTSTAERASSWSITTRTTRSSRCATAQGCLVRGRGRAVRRRRQEIRPRLVHHQERRRRRHAEGRGRSRSARHRRRRRADRQDACASRAARRILHTWATTQTEGWWRQAFDIAKVPFTYISTQHVADDENLGAKFDVIVFPPVGRGTKPSSTACRCGATRCRGRRPLNAEPRIRRSNGRHASGTRLDGRRASAGLRAPRRSAAHVDGHRGARGRHRLHAGTFRRAAPAPAHRRQRRAIEDGGRHEPDRVRLQRQPRDLVRQRTHLRRLEHLRRRAAAAASGRTMAATGRRGAARPTIPMCRRGGRASTSRRSRRSRPGRRCR